MPLQEWVLSIMQQLGYVGIAFLMFLDNVFPPVPSELIMPSAGYTAAQGQLWIGGVILAGSFGSILAAAVLYAVGRCVSLDNIFNFCDRYGRFVGLKSDSLRQSLQWFERYGHWVVFFGRMIPAIRSLISIPAGMSRMPFIKFMLYSSLGTVIWTSFLAYVGYYLGNNQQKMQQLFSQISYGIFAVIALFIIIYIVYRFYRKQS